MAGPLPEPIGPEEAKKIALAHLKVQEDPTERTLTVRREGQNWWVLVEAAPVGVGPYVIVLVSPEENVVKVMPGR